MAAGRVLIGWILKAHGIRGEVTFTAAGDDPEVFHTGAAVFLEERDGTPLTVRTARPGPRAWLLGFEEVTDRDSAESLVGRPLFVDEEALPPLPEGAFYQFQLVGQAVTRFDGTDLGRVSRVIDMPGHDLLEVRGGGGEFLIPLRREFVAWIDLERGEIRLADRADLLEAQRRDRALGAGLPHRGSSPRARSGRWRPDHSSGSTS